MCGAFVYVLAPVGFMIKKVLLWLFVVVPHLQARPRLPQPAAVQVSQPAPVDFDALLQEFTGRSSRPAGFQPPLAPRRPQQQPSFNAIPAVPQQQQQQQVRLPQAPTASSSGASFSLNTNFG